MPWLLCRDCATTAETAAAGACPACGSVRTLSHPELPSLSIAHVDCDAFYASVEKRDAPHLAPLPLIVGHPGGRGVVTTACYIARRFGIRSAMPMFQALERCPEAVVIPPNMAKYKAVSSEIREIFRAATPIIEPVSLDEAYLDLADEHRQRGTCAADALAEVAQRVERDVGITVSIGLSANKFMAKLASELRKPAGFSVIGQAEALSFLAPLSVRKIHGVGSATAKRMEEAGFNTIGDLQALPAQALAARYGKFGSRLAQFVRGEDSRTVTPDRPTKSISAETTFRRDTAKLDELLETSHGLAARVASQLTRKGLAAGTVVLKLKTADFRIVTRNRRLAHPTQKADILAECAEALLARELDGRFFRLLGIGAADLRPAVEADPVDLFGFAEQGAALGLAMQERG